MWHSLSERMAEHLNAGGSLMAPLLAVSVFMWALAIVKTAHFLRDRRRELPAGQCLDLLRREGPLCTAELAGWQADILARYMAERCADAELNRAMLDGMRLRQEARAMRSIGTILLLAAVAPLLGLLGTVSGMITTFDVISQFGTGNARALASGISEALITTQSGLVAAVPGLLLGGFLLQRAHTLKGRMELFCIGLMQAGPEGGEA